ncbi:MAG TPA: DNA adenine methylase [Methyloradius sp.]
MTITKPAIRYHGSKFRLAAWIQSFFPPHTCYVESFGGAAGVLLQKPRAYAEVYNDLDGSVVNFFRVIKDPITRDQLIKAVIMTPYAREVFESAWDPSDDPIEDALRLCIRAQMGFGSAGATKGSTGFRIDSKRDYGTAMDLWAEYPDAICAAGQRFCRELIENRPAISILQQHDAPTTLHFVDPPYVLATRVIRGNADGGKGAYRHELTNDDHVELLQVLCSLTGSVVLSGYESDLYNINLPGWKKQVTSSRIAAGRGGAIRQEVVWLNPRCVEALEAEVKQSSMFA